MNLIKRNKQKNFLARRSFYIGGNLLITFLFLATALNAQPLPPDPEGGNPVPVGGAIYLLLASISVFGAWKLSKKKK